jgi:hypothetical protein
LPTDERQFYPSASLGREGRRRRAVVVYEARRSRIRGGGQVAKVLLIVGGEAEVSAAEAGREMVDGGSRQPPEIGQLLVASPQAGERRTFLVREEEAALAEEGGKAVVARLDPLFLRHREEIRECITGDRLGRAGQS